MKTYKKGFLTLLLLIGVTSAALVYLGKAATPAGMIKHVANPSQAVVSVNTKLVQDKTLIGSDGLVSVALSLSGANQIQPDGGEVQPVDLVVVLDRSGSMNGQKISDARRAVIGLMERLTPRDRLGIVAYSDNVEIVSAPVAMNNLNLGRLTDAVRGIYSGGGTNLGGGLDQGIAMLLRQDSSARQRRVILISDGLANQGVVEPAALGAMAANASEHNVTVSTVGVGYDFNENLMTAIADHGAGSYYFLENPQAFAQVFEKEFQTSRNVVAGNLELRIPLHDGIELVEAGGYPISREGSSAVVRPGDLLAGGVRNLFLTYRVPTAKVNQFSMAQIEVRYQHNGVEHAVVSSETHKVACVEDRKAVVASIDEKAWSDQVVKEEYSSLKDKVADAIRKGEKEQALQSIQKYEEQNRTINQSVGSAAVSKNLDNDVQDLRQSVEMTFAGAPAAVEVKKKQQAKALQYESYKIRRDKK